MEINKVIVKDFIATYSIKFGFDLAEKCSIRQLYVVCVYLYFFGKDGASVLVAHP
jgi:hypothetical protein